MSNKLRFEDKIEVIDNLIARHRSSWTLKARVDYDYDDVSQILRSRIYNKWEQWDQSRPFEPWANKLIHNAIINVVRDLYSNFKRPCLDCALNEGADLCREYGKQCNLCPLYAKWEKTKKRAYDVKLPLSINDHHNELFGRPADNLNYEKAMAGLNKRLKVKLKPIEWRLYDLLYIQHKSEDEVAKEMGFKNTEKDRKRYKRILQLKKSIVNKAKKILEKHGIEY